MLKMEVCIKNLQETLKRHGIFSLDALEAVGKSMCDFFQSSNISLEGD